MPPRGARCSHTFDSSRIVIWAEAVIQPLVIASVSSLLCIQTWTLWDTGRRKGLVPVCEEADPLRIVQGQRRQVKERKEMMERRRERRLKIRLNCIEVSLTYAKGPASEPSQVTIISKGQPSSVMSVSGREPPASSKRHNAAPDPGTPTPLDQNYQ